MGFEPPRPEHTGLPVEGVLGDLRELLSSRGVAVLQAEPGAGKTTVVPLRLLNEPWLSDGRILVLEPRRIAARAAARRMAELLGEQVGDTIGYTTRDERRVGRHTRIEVVTDGILTRRIQRDPGLEGTALVVFDEFHERHLQSDLGLVLALDVRSGLRPDLRLLVMSATLDTASLSTLFGETAVVSSGGRSHPITIRWRPGRPSSDLATQVGLAISEALRLDTGDVLAFLPGVGEIRAVGRALGDVPGVEVLTLHGGLSGAEQDRVLRAGASRRVVLSTDLAASSVTVEGIGVVVDAGLARRPAYDAATGLSRLRTRSASRADADQRAGRAGRTGPGVAYRLWSETEHLTRRAFPEPEIVSTDLAALALELTVWGAPPECLRWIDPPPPAALSAAVELLTALGAIENGRPSELGRALAELPVHPRLARMLLAAPPAARRSAGLLAALLSERDVFRRPAFEQAPSADVTTRLSLLDGRGDIARVADRAAVALVLRRGLELSRRAGRSGSEKPQRTAESCEAADPGRILAAAYPDRIAQARGGGRYRMRSGGGAVLPPHDPLVTSEWLVVAEVEAALGAAGRADGRIRLAAAIDHGDVERLGRDQVRTETRLDWDAQLDDLRATTERVLDALVLESTCGPATPGPSTTAALVERAVATGLRVLAWTPAARSLQARVVWVERLLGDEWPDLSDAALAADVNSWLEPRLVGARGRADLARIDLLQVLAGAIGGRRAELDRLAPANLSLANGRTVPIDYNGERPRAAVRVQDLFGTTRHPDVGGGRMPVTLELLSPAGRPIQITADLPGFWAGSWREVRKEMASRYPKHPWPADPATAPPPPTRPRRNH